MIVVNSGQMRSIEAESAELGLPGPALMENAGRAVADLVEREAGSLIDQNVLILVGPGNNGGDGLVVARHLHDSGARVVVYAFLRTLADEAKLRHLQHRQIPVLEAKHDIGLALLHLLIGQSSLVIDAIIGTGQGRPIDGLLRDVLAVVNGRDARRSRLIAVDVPTGLDADTGWFDPAGVVADCTITLGFPKIGLFLPPAQECTGRVIVADIGIPPSLGAEIRRRMATPEVVAGWIPPRPSGGHKGSFGKVMVVGGSSEYRGAPGLTAMGAYRVGAGVVTVAAPSSVIAAVAARFAEPTFLTLPASHSGAIVVEGVEPLIEALQTYDVVAVGPGLGRRPETAEFLRRLLAHADDVACHWVIDADGLNLLSEIPDWWKMVPDKSVLTPHPGEMARLEPKSSSRSTNRIELAEDTAAQWQQTVVLKGAYTVIAAPDGLVTVNPFANPALATAGTGDVLTGAIAGLLSQGARPERAAVAGAYVHGLAGDLLSHQRGSAGGVSGDLLELLPLALRQVLQQVPDRFEAR